VLGLIPLDQLQRLQHRPVHRVVRPELQRLQDLDQPDPVVVGVGGLEAPLPGLPVGRPLRLELAHQVQQHLQPAGRRLHHLLDDAVRLSDAAAAILNRMFSLPVTFLAISETNWSRVLVSAGALIRCTVAISSSTRLSVISRSRQCR